MEHAPLWRPQPFKEPRPAWCEGLPGLPPRLLALSDAALGRVSRDDAALYDLLAEDLPVLAELAALDDAGFRARFSGSPIKRIGRDRFVRNVLYAIGNSGDPGLRAAAEALTGELSPGALAGGACECARGAGQRRGLLAACRAAGHGR